MKTVKIVYESYDAPHDPAPRERAISLTLEDKDADRILSVEVPYSRSESLVADGERLFTSLWSMEFLFGRYMIAGSRILRIQEEDADARKQ